MDNEMKPKFHKIEKEIKGVSRGGKITTTYVLKYNRTLWEKAACQDLDTELFFPDKEAFTEAEERVFQNMCVECPVMMACLEWALAHEKWGIWAGTTPANRRFIRSKVGWVLNEPKL